jgi:hypothetical protein
MGGVLMTCIGFLAIFFATTGVIMPLYAVQKDVNCIYGFCIVLSLLGYTGIGSKERSVFLSFNF